MSLHAEFSLRSLQESLRCMDPQVPPLAQLRELVRQGLDILPMPASGQTLQRWQALAEVAAHDLSLAKLYEGHTDALAILQELGFADARPAGCTWGVWAAEAPDGRTHLRHVNNHEGRLHGRKSWCSGADGVTHGLLTCWPANTEQPQLAAVAMGQTAIRCESGNWHAVGMAGSTSFDLSFDDAAATLIGPPGAYLSRPGFWQGGAGIAACWYGGAVGVAEALRRVEHAAKSPAGGFREAALGHVDMHLQQTRAVLRESAAWIDAHPLVNARAVALRARLSAEACATAVLQLVGETLGAGPYCRDAGFARRAADLPVFIRQSHAGRDMAALGAAMASAPISWSL